MRRCLQGLFGLAISFLINGCVAVAPMQVPGYVPSAPNLAAGSLPAHIAILPIANASSDPDGPIIVRALAVKKLGGEMGYLVQQPNETDDRLAAHDLMWSGHPGRTPLTRQDPAVLTSWLGVEAVMHGELISYSKGSLSIYTESHVKVKFWLTDITGKTLWQGVKDASSGGFSSGSVSIDTVLGASALPPEVLERARKSELASGAWSAVEAVFFDFPRR